MSRVEKKISITMCTNQSDNWVTFNQLICFISNTTAHISSKGRVYFTRGYNVTKLILEIKDLSKAAKLLIYEPHSLISLQAFLSTKINGDDQ